MVATPSLAATRMQRLGLADPAFDTPEAVVSWLGAAQAQDYYGSLWALGSRMGEANEATIERAIAERRIVRTWPMRGTLHFVAPADARWMVELLAPRVVAANRARIERDLGLDAATLGRSRKIIEKALRDGKPMPRSDVYATLEAAGIGTDGTRGQNITGWLAHQGVLCCGPRIGKQPSFVLLDAWIAAMPQLSRDEALSRLALRYFCGHGPATVQDLAWWSGLTVRDAQRSIDSVASQLQEVDIDGKRYWSTPDLVLVADAGPPQLLAPFDEYLVGYRDRSAAVESARAREVIGINGLVNPAIVVDGKVVGTWKRALGKASVEIALSPFRALRKTELAAINRAAKRYAGFLGLKPTLSA